jgi:5-methylcytosine-specific restriction endonuclease McrA
VIKILPKDPRVQLSSEAYAQLRLAILTRDGWRCQNCGSLQNLEVHHQQFRSQSGNDSAENLIALCSYCHAAMHI